MQTTPPPTPQLLAYRSGPPTGLRRWVPSRQAVRMAGLGLALATAAATVVARDRLMPVMSRGCSHGCGDSALKQNLAILRNALDLYHTEHGEQYPAPAEGITVADLLTMYSDAGGTRVSATRDEYRGVVYGPYLRTVPRLTEGPERGQTRIGFEAVPGVAWVYDPAAGTLRANVPGRDPAGLPYAQY